MTAMTSPIVLGEKHYCESAKSGERLVIMDLGEGCRGEGWLGFFVVVFWVLFLQVFLKIEIITK